MNEQLIIYKAANARVEVRYDHDTLWLSLNHIAQLFGRDKSVISRHIKNIFKEGELAEKATVAKYATVQKEAGRDVARNIEYYNLDVIISVGYRVNSVRGTQFRIWATKVLKNKLLESVRLQSPERELIRVVKYISRITGGKALEKEEATGLLNVITGYSRALEILDRYDHQRLELKPLPGKSKRIKADTIRKLVRSLKRHFGGSHLFGLEKDQSLESSVAAIYQSFGGKELYPSPEIKAANLLYFMVKNHSFVDGNKRIAAASFIFFLYQNNILYNKRHVVVIDNNTLVALTLMVAESNPKEREMLVKVIVNLLARD